MPWTENNTVCLFVVLSEAFDPVHRRLLLSLRHDSLFLLISLKSDFMEMASGVPQGSILAPVLFGVFMNQPRE